MAKFSLLRHDMELLKANDAEVFWAKKNKGLEIQIKMKHINLVYLNTTGTDLENTCKIEFTDDFKNKLGDFMNNIIGMQKGGTL